jgi:hypothetical protein
MYNYLNQKPTLKQRLKSLFKVVYLIVIEPAENIHGQYSPGYTVVKLRYGIQRGRYSHCNIFEAEEDLQTRLYKNI